MVTSVFEMAESGGAISPSQVKTAKLCMRKWGFEKLDGDVQPSGPAAEFGGHVHLRMETYFSTGVHPYDGSPASEVAQTGLPHWPRYGEVKFDIELHINTTFRGIDFHGYQDIGFFDPESGLYVVGDHKTTSDFKWALTSNDLDRNPQALIYAHAAMQRHAVDSVELRWVYMRTRGAKQSRVSRLVVDRGIVERGLDEMVVPVARLIKKAREEQQESGITAMDLPFNPGACNHYGGCPYKHRCNLSPMDQLKGMFNMDALQRLAQKKAEQAQAKAEADSVKPIENDDGGIGITSPERHREPPGSLIDKLKSVQTATTAQPASTPANTGSLQEKLARLKNKPTEGVSATTTGANPSETAKGAPEAPKGQEKVQRTEVEQTPVSQPAHEPPRTGAPDGVTVTNDEMANHKVGFPPGHETAKPKIGVEFCLLENCLPVSIRKSDESHNAIDYVMRVHQEFCESRKVDDYRAIQYTGAAEFGAFFERRFKDELPWSGFVYADTRQPHINAVLHVMERMAKYTFRSVAA